MSKALITKKEARYVLSIENRTEARNQFPGFLPFGSLVVMITTNSIGWLC